MQDGETKNKRTLATQGAFIQTLGFIMKRTITILEIILLVFILYAFAWGRFDGKLSTPFYFELTPIRVLINIGITVAVIFRVFQLIKLARTGSSASLKLQLMALGIYLLMIGTDLFMFIKWNIYANMYFYATAILLTPVFLGVLTTIKNEKIKRNPNKTYKQ